MAGGPPVDVMLSEPEVGGAELFIPPGGGGPDGGGGRCIGGTGGIPRGRKRAGHTEKEVME